MTGQEYYPHSEKLDYLLITFKWINRDPSSTFLSLDYSATSDSFFFFEVEYRIMIWDPETPEPENVCRGRHTVKMAPI